MHKEKRSRWFRKSRLVPLLSLVLGLLVGAIIILLSGNNPLYIYGFMFKGALGSRNGIMQTLLQATPLIFCGLSVAVGMRGGLLNIGVEGQLYIGALLSTIVGVYVHGLPPVPHVALCLLAGMAGGALWSFLPIWLKLKRGTHEVVSALMLNYVATLFVDFMVNYPLKAAGPVAQSEPVLESALLPKLFARSQVSAATLLAVAAAVVIHLMFKRTALGYQITITGANPAAARAGGIPSARVMVVTMLLAGLCSGLAGAGEVLGTHGRLIAGFSPGYGFDGIAVAVLGSSPIMVVFSALLFGALRAGGVALSYGTNLSVRFTTALQGIIILLIAAPELCRRFLNWKPPHRRTKAPPPSGAGAEGEG